MLKDFVKLDKKLTKLLTTWQKFGSYKFEITQDDCDWDEFNFLVRCGYVTKTKDELVTLSKPQNWKCEVRLTHSGRVYKELCKQWYVEQSSRLIVTAITLLTSVASIVLSLISLTR